MNVKFLSNLCLIIDSLMIHSITLCLQPEVIGSLGNLTELWFDNNKVKSLPPLMGRLKKLAHVDASKNKVDWVTEELELCTQLTDLHLSSNNLKVIFLIYYFYIGFVNYLTSSYHFFLYM